MNNAVYIVHLSDLHIDPMEEGETRPVFDHLCNKLSQFRDEVGKNLDLMIVSGDLVNQGAGSYAVAGARIGEVLEACGLGPDRLFLVPGNHDVVWKKCSKTYQLIVSSLRAKPSEFEKLDADTRELFRPGFAAYSEFAEQFPLVRGGALDLPGFAQADLSIAGIDFRLCGLNSAILAGPVDGGKTDAELHDRIIGRKILYQMLSGKSHLNLVVSHYPLSWINGTEGKEVTERLQRAGAVYFHGHIHEADPQLIGVQPDSMLLALGVGSMYGEKWFGKNHCQVLELNFDRPNPILHEWFWFSRYGWRKMEPLDVTWPGWEYWRKKGARGAAPGKHAPSGVAAAGGTATGLVSIGNYRDPEARTAYYQKALEQADEGSELLVVGRSLIDFSLLGNEIEAAINEKKVHIKLALLDENTIAKGESWIEKPSPEDWAINDVPTSMQNFRRIRVAPDTGRLSVYGLPFYSSHSFIAYTSQKVRYCLDEVGMALRPRQRPYVEFAVTAPGSYGASLENLYRTFLTLDRLLLVKDGGSDVECDTAQRAKMIVHKIAANGLVDLGVGRAKIDWRYYRSAIQDIINQTPEGGEILLVGRSLISWAEHLHYEELAKAIVLKNVRCTFIMADPTVNGLQSLVYRDYAARDLQKAWDTFTQDLPLYIDGLLKKHPGKSVTGRFELYGIPAFLPETFAIYTRPDGVRYCTLEIGIGVPPQQRPILYFDNVSDEDIFTHLEQIYRSITDQRTPAVSLP